MFLTEKLPVVTDMHRGLLMMFKKVSNVNIVCIVGMLNEDENLKIGHTLNKVKNDATKMITDAKNKYYSKLGEKFCDPDVGIKTYWKALHKIINKKQVMNIPPILLNGVFITNFQN